MKFKEVILLMMAGLNANAGFVTAIAVRDRGPHTLPKEREITAASVAPSTSPSSSRLL